MNIFVVKGQSGSGKSTRLFELIKFFKFLGYEFVDYFHKNKKNNKVHIGILNSDLNLLIIGHIFNKNGAERFNGVDDKYKKFCGVENFSDFLTEMSQIHNVVIEGSITRTNRLRPEFLHDYCGFDGIFVQYYSFGIDQKEEYLKRIVLRSGKEPKNETGWDVCKRYHQDYHKTVEEANNLSCNTFVSFEYFDSPVWDLGMKMLFFNNESDEVVGEFINFSNNKNNGD